MEPIVLINDITIKVDGGGVAFSLRSRDYKDAQIVIVRETSNEVQDDTVRRGGDLGQTLDASYYKGPGNRNGKEREVLAMEPTYMSDRKGHNGITEDGTATTLTQNEHPIISAKEMEDATERNEILRLLQETYGTQAVVEWGIAVLDALQQAEVLREGMHESRVQGETENRNELDGCSLPCAAVVAEWIMRDLRQREKCGCPSQGWESAEQRYVESTETMPELPHENAQTAKDLFDLWSSGQGIGLLQQALHQIQKIWESALGERTGGGDAMRSVVRRLTPLE